jgi:lipoteichoic acid synthase
MSVEETPRTAKRNVVLMHLESTRACSTTPYNEKLKTMPFLEELARSSLLVERAYTTVSRTSKAIVSVNCGIQPHLVEEITEARPGGIPAQGLPDLLKEYRYSTAFFQSSTENFENFRDLVENFGYAEYYPLEALDEDYREGFEWTNHFGYEDDILLRPSEEWLKKQRDQPFMVTYLMGTGHEEYLIPSRYGYEHFSNDEMLDRYLNCLRYQDFFVRNLINQYKELGYYENTIFVIYGDHGEGFGEHGRWWHEDVIGEEGARVPLIVHAPGWFENGERVEGLANHTDIMPTVLDMLGYRVNDGEYPGYSLLRPPPEDRTLFFSCFHDANKGCASLKGNEKYIYYYEALPEEFFDLGEDPFEVHNIVNERDERELRERRNEIVAWRARVNAVYEGKIAAG